MARIRTIKPEFPQSESMGRVSRDARLLFVMLWTISDDHGRSRAHSRMLASLLFPYDDDAGILLPKWLDELEKEGCIRLYKHSGSQYLQITKWNTHQKIDKPSKPQFPGMDDGIDEARESVASIRELSSEEGIKDQGREGTKEGKGTDLLAPSPASPSSPPAISLPLNDGSDFPITIQQVTEFATLYPAVDVMQELRSMRAWAITNPTKRKTKSGVMRFVNGWLAKEQDSPKHAMRTKTSNETLRGVSA
jgi:hypothetical protein